MEGSEKWTIICFTPPQTTALPKCSSKIFSSSTYPNSSDDLCLPFRLILILWFQVSLFCCTDIFQMSTLSKVQEEVEEEEVEVEEAVSSMNHRSSTRAKNIYTTTHTLSSVRLAYLCSHGFDSTLLDNLGLNHECNFFSHMMEEQCLSLTQLKRTQLCRRLDVKPVYFILFYLFVGFCYATRSISLHA